MKSIITEIVIEASTEKVWDVLMNHRSYPNWNPFIKEISGSSQEGENLAVTMQIEGKKPMNFTPVVLVNAQQKEFRWKGKMFVTGLFDGEHYFLLEQIGPNKTKFIQGENFTGILSGVLMKMIGEDTQAGFDAMNLALKNQVENN